MNKRRGFKSVCALSTVLLLGTIAIGVTSCSGPASNQNSNAKVVVTGGKNGYIGDTIQLTAQIFGQDDQAVVWVSEDASVATVDENGLVTLVGEGSVRIVAISKANSNVKSSPLSITSFSTENGIKMLEVTSLPTRVKYKVNENVSFEGLEVSGYSYVNGIRVNDTGVDFELSDLTFSLQDGAKLSKKGDITVEVTKEGYKKATFVISVNDKIIEKALYVSKLPKKTTYRIGDDALAVESCFDSTGLEVREITYEDGVKTKEALSRNYTLSVENGEEFIKEGNHEIVVSKEGFNDVSFGVMVYTKDITVYKLIKDLQTARNFEVEVLNNVGTSKDSYGFHFVRTYNENYYDEVEYQNTYNQETKQVEFTKDEVKSHFGFASYKDGDTNGVFQYKENAIGRLQADSVVSEGINSWWDRAGTLASLFTTFDLDLVPRETLNGKYIATNVEVVPGDNEMGEETAKKYPFISQFLGYCGWSTSLLTIMDRFQVSILPTGELSMLASFGHFGITELRVNKIGGASNPKVDKALAGGKLKPTKTVLPELEDMNTLFKRNNYKRYEYKDGITSRVFDYYNENYYMNAAAKKGYIALPDGIYAFESAVEGGKTSLVLGEKQTTNAKTVPEFLSENRQANAFQYISHGLDTIFGNEENPKGKMYTFSKFEGFSTDLQVCYQSFDLGVLKGIEEYFGQVIKDGRAWLMTTYKDESHAIETIQSVELWDIAFTGSGGSGMVAAFGDFGNSEVDWVEAYLNSGK